MHKLLRYFHLDHPDLFELCTEQAEQNMKKIIETN